jgi:uncharacterized protein (TIGR02266 family)
MDGNAARQADDFFGFDDEASGFNGAERLPPQTDPEVEPRHLQVAPGPAMEPAPRFGVHLPVTVCWGGLDRRRTAVDVSKEGLFVETPDYRAVGDMVQMIVRLPRGENLRVLCSVERVVAPEESAFCGGMPGMGLRFFLMDARMRKGWDGYLDDLARGTSPFAPDPELPEHMGEVPLELTRRRAPRREGHFRVRVKGLLRDKEFLTEDISEGGLFIATEKPGNPGVRLNLFVVHPLTQREMALEAVVRWTRSKTGPDGDAPGMGVQIITESAEDKDAFLHFLNEG